MSRPKRPALTFTAGNHQYRLDGKPVVGVTTLIKGGLPSPALMYWSAKSVAEYVADNPEAVTALHSLSRDAMIAELKGVPWAKRDRAAVRGTEVHDFAEQIVKGESVQVPPHLEGYVQACADFLDDFQVQPILAEVPVAHRAHWWAGKPDLIAKVHDGRTILIDWKTADSGIWPETAFQLAAYRNAEFYIDAEGEEHPLPPIDDTWAVHLQPDGYTVYPVKGDQESYNLFRHMAFVAQRKITDMKNKGVYVLPALESPTTQEIPA